MAGRGRTARWAVMAVALAACTTTAESRAPTVDTTPPDATTVPPRAPTPTASAAETSTPSDAARTSSTMPSATSATSMIPSTTTEPAAIAIDACPPTGQSIWEVRPPSDIAPPPLPPGWTSESIGRSVRGRPIELLARRVPDPARRVLAVGGIHGNEPVSPPTVRGLVLADVPADIDVLLVPSLNPDGVAAGVRCNANGVDLNRNFPWEWRPDDGGPSPLSEPESAAIAALIGRTEPDVVVWVHQPYGYVSSIGPTPDGFESAWSVGSGVPVRPDVTQHGGGESWTALDAGRDSMLIEIDTWDDSPAIVAAHRAGFERLVASLDQT